MNKLFNGKAIYNPKGKAGEYSQWACNFYVGCSNGCEYCYCKKGILKAVMGMDDPQLKKCFKSEFNALEVFELEMFKNRAELQKHGLFFTFTSDPFLQETIDLTYQAVCLCVAAGIPVKFLTKRVDLIKAFALKLIKETKNMERNIAFGYTLTGHDELEPNASTNSERIESMMEMHDMGFKTFASIEPVIDFDSSYLMIVRASVYCDLFKIGLMSGKKYDKGELTNFAFKLMSHCPNPIYFKDGFLKQLGFTRDQLPVGCVGNDYDIFKTLNPNYENTFKQRV